MLYSTKVGELRTLHDEHNRVFRSGSAASPLKNAPECSGRQQGREPGRHDSVHHPIIAKADIRNLAANSDNACKLSYSDVVTAICQRPMRHHLELPAQPHVELAVLHVVNVGPGMMAGGWAKTHDWSLLIESRVLDFGRIDPLEIVVRPAQGGWAIHLAGTAGQTIGTRVSASYAGKLPNDDDSLQASMRIVHDLSLSAPCLEKAPTGLACTGNEGSVTEADITLVDMETAHRLARAMVHEALTCGGTKAVSPF